MGPVKHGNGSATAVYTLRVDRAKLARIHEIAAAEHRSLTGKLRQMIDEEITRNTPVEAASDGKVAA